MQALLPQPWVDCCVNRAHQLTDAEESQAGRWGCLGNSKASYLSLLLWLVSPGILTLSDLPHMSLPGGQVLSAHSCPSHHAPGDAGGDKLDDQRQRGVAACPKSNGRVERCTVVLPSSSKTKCHSNQDLIHLLYPQS